MKFKFFLILLAVFTSTAANAAKLTCPATVRTGAALTGITAIAKNEDCNKDMFVNNTIISITGNSGASGTIGLRGPFVNSYPSTLLKAATCTTVYYNPSHPEYGSQTNVTPTKLPITIPAITASIPAGTLAVVSVGVMDTDNKIHLIGACPIRVIH